TVSLNRPIGDDGFELGDLFPDEGATDPAEAGLAVLRARRVDDALGELDDLERRVLELRFGFDGEQRTLETIGKELGISRERTRQPEDQAPPRLQGELADLEADADDLALAA